MVSTSGDGPRDGERRRSDRRREEKPFPGTDRRVASRRSGADRRRYRRDPI